MARIKKAQRGYTSPSADSTAYFKNQEKSFRQLAKSEKGDNEVSKFNKRFFENEAGKAVSSQVRQSRKGSPGYDKDGFPIKNKKMKTGGKIKKAQAGLKAPNKRVGPVDPQGAWTKVQKSTLAGKRTKASLTPDKQLGATRMTARKGAKVTKIKISKSKSKR